VKQAKLAVLRWIWDRYHSYFLCFLQEDSIVFDKLEVAKKSVELDRLRMKAIEHLRSEYDKQTITNK